MTKEKSSLYMNNTQQSGYTLIQMAIALLVIGIIAGVFLQTYSLYEQTQKMITTQDSVKLAVDKIQIYRQSYGKYPCPSAMNVARTDVNYGTATTYAAYIATPVGTCTNGICIEESTRTIAAVAPRVRVGAIPFRDLQIDEESTFDGYGSRLWYAVTEDMCNLTTFDDTKGGINILNERNESQINPPGSAAFLVLSSGPNKVGAYSKMGTQQAPCSGSADIENCRDMSLATQPIVKATYLSSFQTDATAATTYDDTIQYFASATNPLWRRETITSENITNMTTQNVGIGTNTPTSKLTIPQTSVDTATGGMAITDTTSSTIQNGALKADGKVLATKYCDETKTTNCFQPKDIAGNPASGTGGITCPAGQYPVGVKSDGTNAKFECKNDIGVFCPANQVLTGFTGNPRQPQCAPAVVSASCAPSTVTWCGTPFSLPATTSGTQKQITAGDCRKLNYQCNNGNWGVLNDWGGECTDRNWTASNQPCGQGFTGKYTYSGTVCTGTQTSNWDTACPPTCIPYTTSSSTACPANFSGTGPTTTQTYICSSDKRTHVLDPSKTTTSGGACSCSKKSQNTFSSCPTGQKRKASAPNPPTTDTASTNSWPSDIMKGVVSTTTVNTTSCTDNAATTLSYCECNPADIYTTQLGTPPSCKQAKTGTRNVNGTAYDYKYDVFKATMNTTTCTANAATKVDNAQFEDAQYYWREQSGGATDTNKSSKGSYPDINEACTCSSQSGSLKTCARANSNGTYDFYTCQCLP